MAFANSFFSLASSSFRQLGFRDLEHAVLGFSVVEARLADPVLAVQIGRLHAGLVIFQDGNDLLFGMALAERF